MKLWFVYHYKKKAQALVPEGDASNERLDVEIREHTLAQLEWCYEIIIGALCSLKKGEAFLGGTWSSRESHCLIHP